MVTKTIFDDFKINEGALNFSTIHFIFIIQKIELESKANVVYIFELSINGFFFSHLPVIQSYIKTAIHKATESENIKRINCL